MSEQDDRDWAEETLQKMRASGHRYWLSGSATCIGCGYTCVMVCPYPVGLNPDCECSKCGKFLMVYDTAEDWKAQLGTKKYLDDMVEGDVV